MKIPQSHRATALAAILAAALRATSQPLALGRFDQQPTFKKEPWDEAAWKQFYSESQGSRLIPRAWANALKHTNGQPSAACRVRQIEVEGKHNGASTAVSPSSTPARCGPISARRSVRFWRTHMILENKRRADAPLRPPFLWNAPRQDHTQWPGFADNGDRLLAMAHNVGQAYGVFGEFFPEKDDGHLLRYHYTKADSVELKRLIEQLEHLVECIGPPNWPWPVNKALADIGREIYEKPHDEGGRADCHEIRRDSRDRSTPTPGARRCRTSARMARIPVFCA